MLGTTDLHPANFWPHLYDKKQLSLNDLVSYEEWASHTNGIPHALANLKFNIVGYCLPKADDPQFSKMLSSACIAHKQNQDVSWLGNKIILVDILAYVNDYTNSGYYSILYIPVK